MVVNAKIGDELEKPIILPIGIEFRAITEEINEFYFDNAEVPLVFELEKILLDFAAKVSIVKIPLSEKTVNIKCRRFSQIIMKADVSAKNIELTASSGSDIKIKAVSATDCRIRAKEGSYIGGIIALGSLDISIRDKSKCEVGIRKSTKIRRKEIRYESTLIMKNENNEVVTGQEPVIKKEEMIEEMKEVREPEKSERGKYKPNYRYNNNNNNNRNYYRPYNKEGYRYDRNRDRKRSEEEEDERDRRYRREENHDRDYKGSKYTNANTFPSVPMGFLQGMDNPLIFAIPQNYLFGGTQTTPYTNLSNGYLNGGMPLPLSNSPVDQQSSYSKGNTYRGNNRGQK